MAKIYKLSNTLNIIAEKNVCGEDPHNALVQLAREAGEVKKISEEIYRTSNYEYFVLVADENKTLESIGYDLDRFSEIKSKNTDRYGTGQYGLYVCYGRMKPGEYGVAVWLQPIYAVRNIEAAVNLGLALPKLETIKKHPAYAVIFLSEECSRDCRGFGSQQEWLTVTPSSEE